MRRERRRVALKRRTRGTEVEVELRLDGSGRTSIDTPFGLLNELLELLAAHSGLDLRMVQSINKHADDSYAVDDLATALAEAWRRALGQRPRIRQFGGIIVPVGDALVLAAADLVSPPVFQFGAGFVGQRLEGMELAHLERFLATFTDRIGAGLHVRVLAGKHDGNKCRAIFLAVGRCLAEASAEVDREPAREVAADLDYLESARRIPARVSGLDEAVVEELDEGEAEPAASLPGDPGERSPRRGRRGSRTERGERAQRGRSGTLQPRLTAAGAGDLLEMPSMSELPELPELPDYPDLEAYERVGAEEDAGGRPAERDDDHTDEEGETSTTRRRRRGRRGGRGRRRGERAEAGDEAEEDAGRAAGAHVPAEAGRRSRGIGGEARAEPSEEPAGREEEFAGREEEFAGREEEFAGREKEFAGREKEFAGREGEFAGREEEFAGREEEFAGREEEFAGREEEFAGREEEFAGRDREFAGQEGESSGREEELVGQDEGRDWAPARGLKAPGRRRRDPGGRGRPPRSSSSRGRTGRWRRDEEPGGEPEPEREPAEIGDRVHEDEDLGGRSEASLLSGDAQPSATVSYGRGRRSVRRTGGPSAPNQGSSEEADSSEPDSSEPDSRVKQGAGGPASKSAEPDAGEPDDRKPAGEESDVLDFITAPRGTNPPAAKPRRKRR